MIIERIAGETRFLIISKRGREGEKRQILDRREKCHSYAKQIVPARFIISFALAPPAENLILGNHASFSPSSIPLPFHSLPLFPLSLSLSLVNIMVAKRGGHLRSPL